jgi:response regulator RpfG family c-di-GMP phosphodiesterase
MHTIDHVLLVDNNVTRSSSIEKNIKEEGLAGNIKTTLNGGHALLYLEHASEKIQNSRILILLNIHTPVVNGFEFLESYKALNSIKKNNILIAAINDNLSTDEIDKIKLMGVSDFVSAQGAFSALDSSIRTKFNPQELTEKKENQKKFNQKKDNHKN